METFPLLPVHGADMAMDSGSKVKLIAIILMVAGLGVGLWGYQLSGSIGSQITQAATGSNTNRVMTLYIDGAVSFVIGAYLFAKN